MKIQIDEPGASVEKIVYAKIPVEIQEIILWSVLAIFNIVAMLVAISKVKVHELGAKVEKILHGKNCVKIRIIKLLSTKILI